MEDDTEIKLFSIKRYSFENNFMEPMGLVTPALTRYNLKHDSYTSDPVSNCVDVTGSTLTMIRMILLIILFISSCVLRQLADQVHGPTISKVK